VLYDDGDEEWLDLGQERHKLLRPSKPGAAAAAARKKRKAVLASDDEDDEAADAEDDAKGASDSDSDFSGVQGGHGSLYMLAWTGFGAGCKAISGADEQQLGFEHGWQKHTTAETPRCLCNVASLLTTLQPCCLVV
jgi:hypothetical protein